MKSPGVMSANPAVFIHSVTQVTAPQEGHQELWFSAAAVADVTEISIIRRDSSSRKVTVRTPRFFEVFLLRELDAEVQDVTQIRRSLEVTVDSTEDVLQRVNMRSLSIILTRLCAMHEESWSQQIGSAAAGRHRRISSNSSSGDLPISFCNSFMPLRSGRPLATRTAHAGAKVPGCHGGERNRNAGGDIGFLRDVREFRGNWMPHLHQVDPVRSVPRRHDCGLSCCDGLIQKCTQGHGFSVPSTFSLMPTLQGYICFTYTCFYSETQTVTQCD